MSKLFDFITEFLHHLIKIKDWVTYRYVSRHQYHIVRTDLEPNYYEVDTRMLHACMTLLVHYVEEEHEGAESLKLYVDQESDGSPDYALYDADRSALKIYDWWTVLHPADQKRYDEMLMATFGKDGSRDSAMASTLWALEEKIVLDETTMLHKLIDIRGSLWT